MKKNNMISCVMVFLGFFSSGSGAGIDDSLNDQGDTPLILAVFQQNASQVRQLLLAGADPFRKKKDGANAIDFAIWGSSKEIRNLIFNFQNIKGETPLIRAVFAQDIDNVEKLLKFGADPCLSKDDGANAYDFAAWGRNEKIQNIFNQIGPQNCGQFKKCAFIYESGKAKTYVDKLDEYFTVNKSVHGNKSEFISKYKEIWSNIYEQNISGSTVEIFSSPNLGNADVLSKEIKGDFFDGINYTVTDAPYNYVENEAFVDFANEQIGGGVLGWGFVQEEVEMFESTFLPWVAEVRQYDNRNSLSWCPGISLKYLYQEPVVLRFRLFAHVDVARDIRPDLILSVNVPNKAVSIYGSNFFNIRPDRVKSYLLESNHPTNIYAPAMAAKPFRQGEEYLKDDIQQMTLVAAKAFYLTMLAQHSKKHPIVINTGNWGTGAFNNSLKAAWAMQATAVVVASSFFQEQYPTAGISYKYNAFNNYGKQAVLSAQHELLTRVGKGKKTVEQILDAILELSKQDNTWQVKK